MKNLFRISTCVNLEGARTSLVNFLTPRSSKTWRGGAGIFCWRIATEITLFHRLRLLQKKKWRRSLSRFHDCGFVCHLVVHQFYLVWQGFRPTKKGICRWQKRVQICCATMQQIMKQEEKTITNIWIYFSNRLVGGGSSGGLKLVSKDWFAQVQQTKRAHNIKKYECCVSIILISFSFCSERIGL